MRLESRVAIVSGGAQGIGLAIVEDLIGQGASVVILDAGVSISGEPLQPRLAEEAAARMDRTAALCGDVADTEVARAAVALAQERFGAVDIVVNNAAIIRDAFIFKSDPQAWDAVLRTNLTGAQRLLAAATPVMRDQAKAGRAPGAIVNMVSTAGIYGNFGQAAYGAAKAGLIGLTRIVAHDLARSGIRCNAVAPFAATRVTESIRPANDAQAAYKEKALKVPARYVARLVSYLASDAAAHINGQLFGARGREVFVFSQPRPAQRLLQPQGGFELEAFSQAARALEPYFAELVTDLEAFSGDPVL
ncbi:MAG TPA: SDR family NAD(P)-dependent oxidoreductase [Burkholderiales bacterium]|nr:SDR family NAD(P)-dependent oxidoreductase [Burkholderiales bacterium]